MRAYAHPFYWREASLCVPALPLLMTAGILLGQVGPAAVAVGSAFAVGFGASRDLGGRRWAAMRTALIGMTLATLIGSTFGAHLVVIAALAFLAAAVAAALVLIDEDLWWVCLQVVIALLVSAAYAGPPSQAFGRAGLVLAGGALQILIIAVLARVFPQASARLPRSAGVLPSPPRLVLSHGARAGLSVALALVAATALKLGNSYWAPMTAMLVLRPGLRQTRLRGVARLGGTLGGAIAAMAYVALFGEAPWLLAIGVTLSAGAAFALQKAHYSLLTFAITATVVLLTTLGHGGVVANSEHRLWATILGGAIALGAAAILPHRPRRPVCDLSLTPAEHPGQADHRTGDAARE